MIGWVTWDRGIGLPGHGMWLDPHVKRRLAFVSHAHSDHVRRHEEAIMTRETLALSTQPRRSPSCRVLAYNEPHPIPGGELMLLDAGHMLGSAQLLLSGGSSRLLYTGDVKLRRGSSQAKTFIPRCDVTGTVPAPVEGPHHR